MNTQTISADFPFTSQYVEVDGHKMHYVDEGQGDPILFLHGNPTSSYLWRNIIPYVTTYGRAIAPDLMGFGKSDKPDSDYTFADHAQYLDTFIEALGLTNITLVIHDWGSALGFNYAMHHPDNVKAITFMEAIILPTPSYEVMGEGGQIFKAFRTPEVGWQMLVEQNMFIEQILPSGIMRTLSDEEMNQYRAPFVEEADRKPVWQFPNQIPIGGQPADVHQTVLAYNQWLQSTDVPKLLFTVEPGAILPPELVGWCQANLSNLTVVALGEGTHFIQEDHPHAIGDGLVNWLKSI